MAKARILILDDHADSVLILDALLTSEGHQVLGLTDPRQLILKVIEFEPSVVLLDLHMPHGNGHDLAREVRDHFGARPVLIAISGTAKEPHAYQQALLAGFSHFVTKPYLPSVVLDLVAKYPA